MAPRGSGRHAPIVSTALRLEAAGCIYHINANGLDGLTLFRDDVDRETFFDLLADEVGRSDWIVLEYSLMSTHYHLLLQLRKPTLSSGFQHLQSRYARAYNRRHKRRGVVWQTRFHDKLIESERHLLECIRYIAWNAPRANLCALPEEWPWCSYGAAVGAFGADPVVDEAELLGFFAKTRADARRLLRRYVEEDNPRERWRQTILRRGSEPRPPGGAGVRSRRRRRRPGTEGRP